MPHVQAALAQTVEKRPAYERAIAERDQAEAIASKNADERDLARKDAQDWIKVGAQQEQIIENLEKQVAHLTKERLVTEADFEDTEKERIKYRTALLEVERLLNGYPTSEGVDRLKDILRETLKLPDGPTVDDEADANGY